MNNNSDFITPILNNYSKFLSLENLELTFKEIELKKISNLKVIFVSIICVIPYLGYGWLAINVFPIFISFLISIAELNTRSIAIVILLSIALVILNILAFVLYKNIYSNLNNYMFSSLKYYLRELFVFTKIRELQKRKKTIIDETISLLKDTDCEDVLKQRILFKLSVLAGESVIPDNCNFYHQLISSLSEAGLISVNIFDYNDKIKTIR